MDVTASLTADVEPDVLYDAVCDLGGYPAWLDIVPRAEPVETVAGDVGPQGAEAALHDPCRRDRQVARVM